MCELLADCCCSGPGGGGRMPWGASGCRQLPRENAICAFVRGRGRCAQQPAAPRAPALLLLCPCPSLSPPPCCSCAAADEACRPRRAAARTTLLQQARAAALAAADVDADRHRAPNAAIPAMAQLALQDDCPSCQLNAPGAAAASGRSDEASDHWSTDVGTVAYGFACDFVCFWHSPSAPSSLGLAARLFTARSSVPGPARAQAWL